MPSTNTKTTQICVRVPNDVARMIVFVAEAKAMTQSKTITWLLQTGMNHMSPGVDAEVMRRSQADEDAVLVAKLAAAQTQLDAAREKWRS